MNLAGPKEQLIGRKIVNVILRPFSNGRGGETYDPVIVLDDGYALSFVVEETESGQYGVRIDRLPVEVSLQPPPGWPDLPRVELEELCAAFGYGDTSQQSVASLIMMILAKRPTWV